MGKGQLKLLGRWSSPYVMRVKIGLNMKSLEYENVEEVVKSKSHLLLESNPLYGKVPVLIHNGKPICESMIILQYIDEVWPSGPPILPSHAYDRAIARFWADYIDHKLFPCMKNIITAEEEEARKPYYKEMEEVIARLEDAFGKCSEGKPFFGGNQIGFIDIAFGSYLGWLNVMDNAYGAKLLVQSKAPYMLKFADRFAAHPAAKGLIPDTESLIEFSRYLQIKWRAAIANK